jgi:hypothetical protein
MRPQSLRITRPAAAKGKNPLGALTQTSTRIKPSCCEKVSVANAGSSSASAMSERALRTKERVEMKSTITIFGHDETFDPDSITQYITSDIFGEGYDRRYRYNQLRNDATIIILSHRGKVYGHFDITGWEDPTADDIQSWPKTRRVYIVSKSHSYEKPVSLQDVGITGIQFGKAVNAQEFEAILKLAGNIITNQ